MTGIRRVHSLLRAFESWGDPEDPVKMMAWKFRFGHTTTKVVAMFLCLMAKRSKGPIVEFGTFTGQSSINMSMNTVHPVYTIDSGVADDDRYGPYTPGEDFANADLDNPPRLLLGDSRTVDIPVKPHTAGFCYIDGGHSYEVAKSDTKRAFELIRPDGFIMWDDYHGTWPGVMKMIDELAETVPLVIVDQECCVLWGIEPL